MQFTLRQLMLCVSAFAVWLGLMASGGYLFGPGGIVLFGTFFGIAIFYLLRMALAWSKWSPTARAVGLAIVCASSIAGIFMTGVWFERGLHREGAIGRNLPRLEAALHADPRYESVSVTHQDLKGKGNFVVVHGTVADQEALDSLKQLVEREGIPSAVWQVEIVQE